MTISIDYTNMMAAAVAGALSDADWDAMHERFGAVHASLARKRRDGILGFLELPADRALLAQSVEFARNAGWVRDVLLLGIGGSALGPVALRTALRAPDWNELDDPGRGGAPRFHVLENIDPATIAALLDRLDLGGTLVIVTSKSGGTAETMSQYLVVRERLLASLGRDALTRHLVFVTDPAKGALRPIARAEGIPALDIPPSVGGRFSVLSPVGMLPAALLGIDIQALLEGAGEMARRCDTAELGANPAGIFAALQYLAHTTGARPMHVLMPYSDALRDFAAWFVQLWAESLGKRRPDGTHVGPTPIASLGATDQHSQVQLFMEGPADKTVTFIAVREHPRDVRIPELHADVPELAYLGGHSLAELIDIEQRATAGALAQRGRPNMTLTMDRVDAAHVGALVMLLEYATAFAGELYEIDAFNQPGVELGKQFAYAMMGRPGSEAARREWEQLPKPDPRFHV